MKTVSIIIPNFNEEKYIEKTLVTVCSSDTLGLKKEIIVIDDGSTDNSVSIIKKFEQDIKKNKNITARCILKTVNQGKGAALKEGFLASTGDIILVQDADLEYDPKDYPLVLEPFMEKDADVVYGSRFISNRPHRVLYFWHYQVNLLLTLLSNMLTNLNLSDMETGSKSFKGDLIRKIAPNIVSKRFGIEPEITAKVAKVPNLKFYEVGISYSGRTYTEGKKIGWQDGVKAIVEIIRFNIF